MAILAVTNRDGNEAVEFQIHRDGEVTPEVKIAPTGAVEVELKAGDTLTFTVVENLNG